MSNYIAGLEDYAVEIFVNKNDELKAIYKTRCIDLSSLPKPIMQRLFSMIESDTVAVKSLRRDFGLTNTADQITQYIRCNFKGLDGIPDITADGEITKEIHNCAMRDTCKAAFKVCAPIVGKGGQLTKTEAKVFFLVCQGMLDKEIAAATNTTISTVETQLRNIRLKLEINNRVEIILFAVQHSISFAPTFN